MGSLILGVISLSFRLGMEITLKKKNCGPLGKDDSWNSVETLEDIFFQEEKK